MADTLQPIEKQSDRSDRSGQPSNDAGSGVSDYEKTKSDRSDTSDKSDRRNAVRLPKGFEQNAEGLWYIEPAADEKPEVKTWIGPPIHFLARTRNADSEAWGLLLAWHDPDNKPHRWAMPYAMLNDTRQGWRSELASGGWIGATSQKAKALLGQLLASVSIQSRARCVDRTGWHGSAYVLPDAVIGQGGERLVLQASMATNPFTQAGTLEDWNESIGTWARRNRLLMFAICAALSGPLLEQSGMDSGGFHFQAHSSTGKTTLERGAWSVYGPPSGVRTWRSTSNALEAISSLHSDALLCLDEIGQAPGRVVGEAAYLLANGQGKSRAHTDGSARALRSWRCCILSNGELSIADKLREDGQQVRAGQEVRIVDLSADAGSGMGAWEDLHGHETPGQFSDAIKAACVANYGTLSRAYIEALIQHKDGLTLTKDLAAVVSTWTPDGSLGQVRRVVQRFALAGVAGELAVSFGLVPWAEGEALTAAKCCLDSWLEGRGGTGDQEDRRAVDTVGAFIGRFGSSRFQNIDPGQQERILDRAGFRRTLAGQTQFLFTSEQFRAVLNGLNPAAAAKALDRAGMLHKNDSKGLRCKVSLPDVGRVGVYALTMPTDEKGGESC